MNESVGADHATTLHSREWPHADALGTVVLVHGLGEHIGRYEHVAAFLNSRRWRVAGHDQRGHGRSAGERGRLNADDELLVDLAAAVDAARAAHPGPVVLLGHSMGGLIAARFVAGGLERALPRWERDVDGLVLSSPALDIGLTPLQRLLLATLGSLAPDLAVGNGLAPAWVSRSAAVVSAYTADPLVHDRVTARLTRFMVDGGRAVLAAAPRWRVPTLVLYAGSDRCVRPAGSAAFVTAAPPGVVTSREFPTLYHEIFNEPEQAEVLSALGTWLDTLAFSSPRSPP